MGMNRIVVLLSLAILIHDGEVFGTNAPTTTSFDFSSSTYTSVCFDRYEHLQTQFCNFKIDSMNEKLSAQRNACDATVNSLKEFFGQREQLWHEQNICNATLTHIIGRREVECLNSKDPSNWTRLSTGFYYFSKPNEVANWFVAGYNCKKMGMKLASIESDQENNAVLAQLNATSTSEKDMFWISGTDLGEEGKFVWSATAEPVIFSRFHQAQPDNANGNEHCIHYAKVGKYQFYAWNDWPCGLASRYICELHG